MLNRGFRWVTCGLLIAATTVVAGQPVSAQVPRNATIADFVIIVTASERGIELNCVKGCSWSKQNIELRPGNGTVIVDELGVRVREDRETRRGVTPRFQFAVERTSSEMKFEAVSGTAWRKLSYSCQQSRCSQAIDERGMS